MTTHNAAPPGGWTEADKVPAESRKLAVPKTLPHEIDGVLTVGRTSWTVEKLVEDPEKSVQYAYKLTGVRGAEYVLMRNFHRPYMLFPVNARKFGGTTPWRDGWFTDQDGVLTYLG